MLPSTLSGTVARRRLGRLLMTVLAGIALIGCATPAASTTPSPSASGAPSANLASNKAAALRTRVDLALGAHVLLIARTADAAAGVRTDEFQGYGAAVHEQAGTIASQLQDVSGGNETAIRAKELLSGFDGDMLDYVSAGYKGDANGQAAAMTAMSGTYVPGMADLLAPITGMDKSEVSSRLTAQVQSARAMADAEIAHGDWNGVYGAVDAAYQGAASLGDSLVAGIATHQRGRYPGDASGPAATLQTHLALSLQEQAYLAGFASSAAVGGRPDELAAVRSKLSAGQADVAKDMAPIGSADDARVAPALNDAAGAVVDDANAVAGKNQAIRTQSEAGLTNSFPNAFQTPAKKAGLSGDRALALSRSYGQSLREVAEAEGAKNYQTAPSASRDAAQAAAGLADGLSGAMVKTYAGQFR